MDIQLLEKLPQVQISLAAGERGAVTVPHFTFCQDVDSSPNAAAESAWNDFSVFMRGEMLKPKEISKYSVALVEAPKHGNVVFTDRARTKVDATPRAFAASTFTYRSEVGYLGADSATFQVDSRGRKYLVTVNFLVQPYVAESNNGRTECTAAGMDKKASPSDAKTSALQPLNLVAQASGVVSLSQSESSSELAYVVGNGSAATINLSPTAAGHGWYLDPTPSTTPTTSSPPPTQRSPRPPPAAQTVRFTLPTEFEVRPEEVDMLLMDVPNMPPANTAIVVEAKTPRVATKGVYGTVGVCYLSATAEQPQPSTHGNDNERITLGIRGNAGDIFSQGRMQPPMHEFPDFEKAPIKLLQAPQHGTLTKVPDGDYYYTPKAKFTGNDRAEFEVNFGTGYRVKVVYFIKVNAKFDWTQDSDIYRKYCPPEITWRIVSTEPGKQFVLNEAAAVQSNVDLTDVAYTLDGQQLSTLIRPDVVRRGGNPAARRGALADG